MDNTIKRFENFELGVMFLYLSFFGFNDLYIKTLKIQGLWLFLHYFILFLIGLYIININKFIYNNNK